MAGRALRFVSVVAVLACAIAIDQKSLEDWFASADGLAMARGDARSLAQREWRTLTQCGVTITSLRNLKAVLYEHEGMDLGMADLRREILPLAEHHVSPQKLGSFYTALSSSYTLSGGLALPKVEAQRTAISLVKDRAEPDQLYDLYKVMYGYYGLGFDQKTAQTLSIQQARAGADAAQFKETYAQKRDVQAAVKESINANMRGLIRRYAKDAKVYSAQGFQDYYGARWLPEWLDAPMELRVSSDGRAYTANQFAKHYGSNWYARYGLAVEATQQRLADDGKTYDVKEFKDYYGDQWQGRWYDAPEAPCAQCKPFASGAEISMDEAYTSSVSVVV